MRVGFTRKAIMGTFDIPWLAAGHLQNHQHLFGTTEFVAHLYWCWQSHGKDNQNLGGCFTCWFRWVSTQYWDCWIRSLTQRVKVTQSIKMHQYIQMYRKAQLLFCLGTKRACDWIILDQNLVSIADCDACMLDLKATLHAGQHLAGVPFIHAKAKLAWNNSSSTLFSIESLELLSQSSNSNTSPFPTSWRFDTIWYHSIRRLPWTRHFGHSPIHGACNDRCPMSSSTVRCHIAASPQVRRHFTEQAVWLRMKRMMLVDSVERVRKKCLSEVLMKFFMRVSATDLC